MPAAGDLITGPPVAEGTELDEPTKQLAQIASLFCHWLAEHDEPLVQMAAARKALSLGLQKATAAVADDDDR